MLFYYISVLYFALENPLRVCAPLKFLAVKEWTSGTRQILLLSIQDYVISCAITKLRENVYVLSERIIERARLFEVTFDIKSMPNKSVINFHQLCTYAAWQFTEFVINVTSHGMIEGN